MQVRASAMTWSAMVVLPLDSGPKISTTRPRGKPPTPRARSKEMEPVDITAMGTMASLFPSRMMEPLPNCFSIFASARSIALLFSPFSSAIIVLSMRHTHRLNQYHLNELLASAMLVWHSRPRLCRFLSLTFPATCNLPALHCASLRIGERKVNENSHGKNLLQRGSFDSNRGLNQSRRLTGLTQILSSPIPHNYTF